MDAKAAAVVCQALGMQLGPFRVWTTYRTIGEENAGEAARLAEDLGFGTFWLGGSPQLPALRPLLEATERIAVATGILNVWASDPEQVAHDFAELEAGFPGRVRSGSASAIPRPPAITKGRSPLCKRFLTVSITQQLRSRGPDAAWRRSVRRCSTSARSARGVPTRTSSRWTTRERRVVASGRRHCSPQSSRACSTVTPSQLERRRGPSPRSTSDSSNYTNNFSSPRFQPAGHRRRRVRQADRRGRPAWERRGDRSRGAPTPGGRRRPCLPTGRGRRGDTALGVDGPRVGARYGGPTSRGP